MESVVANRPPTSTDAPGANSTPLGLVRNTWPLAVRRPKISDGLFPSTRLRATADELGWLKLTHALEPIEKLCQFRIAFCDVWSICSLLVLDEMLALPAATLPPVGSVLAVVWANALCSRVQGRSAAPTAKA